MKIKLNSTKTYLIIAASLFSSVTLAQGGSKWSVNGNAVSNTKFVGTTNNEDLIFKANGLEGFRLKSTNNKLVVKGASLFKQKSVFDANMVLKSNLTIKSLEDLAATTNRTLAVNNNGKVVLATPYGSITNPFSELFVLNALKVGNNSIHMGTPASTTQNEIFTTNGPLIINSSGQTTATGTSSGQNTIINPDGGNLGIGTRTPTNSISVVSSGAAGAGMDIYSSNPSGRATVLVGEGNFGRYIYMGYTNSAYNPGVHTAFGSARGNIYTGAPNGMNLISAEHLSFTTGGTTTNHERLRIAKNGNIGIGTISPAAKLDVQGSFRLNNGTQHAGYFLGTNAAGDATWQALPAAQPSIWSLNANDAYYTAGNVGIGVAAPQTSLHVQGEMLITGSPSTQSATLKIEPGTALPTMIGGQPFYLGATVKTISRRSGFVAYTDNNWLNGDDNNGHFVALFPHNNVVGVNEDLTWKAFRLKTGSPMVDKFWIDKLGNSFFDGNVGIGTTTPNEKLSVAGTIQSTTGGFKFPDGTVQTSAAGAQLGSQITPYQNLYVNDYLKVGTNSLWLGGNPTNLGNTIHTTNGDLLINPALGQVVSGGLSAYNTLINPDGGDVGVGTTTPEAKLHVNGTIKSTVLGDWMQFQTTNGNGRWKIHNPPVANQDVLLMGWEDATASNWNWPLALHKNGNVGIGGSLIPTEILDVNGNMVVGDNFNTGGFGEGGKIKFRRKEDGAAYSSIYAKRFDWGSVDEEALIFENNSGAGTFIWRNGITSVNGGEVMRISKEGNVGIGTNAIDGSDFKLSVEGKMRAREILVNASTWSDFVFADDYELNSLEEVELYIEKNNHLPDVPSEKEILENGFDLAKMDATLLQKIEELTLYMIELKKENEELRGLIENK
ncbi:MAG: hypothetical protein COB15_02270 [Flavobacteriales bacterium]|nr:MAG: hypothetical protein COB15_02270 [Flavobacteriales bacterium]